MWKMELNLSQSTDRSLEITALLQAAMHHGLAAVCYPGQEQAHTAPHVRFCCLLFNTWLTRRVRNR